MLTRGQVASVLLHAAIVLALVSSVLGTYRPSLPSVHEDHPSMARLPPPPQQRASTSTGPQGTQFTGPVDTDLNPPRRIGTRFNHGQTVPVTGLVRGQQGKLVTFRLNTHPHLLPEPFKALESGSQAGSYDTSAIKGSAGAPPSSNEELHHLLREHPRWFGTTEFQAEARPDRSKLGEKYNAVQLRGQGLDARTLSNLQGRKLPFFVQGANGKVWFFDHRGDMAYTYTDNLETYDETFIREFFPRKSQDAAESSQATAHRIGILRQSQDAAELSQAPVQQARRVAAGELEKLPMQTAAREATAGTGVSLACKLSNGLRTMFSGAIRP
ncbi:uncharacterized protein SRS1_20008 [Sporisorium reilianum f. sp. reilianum]|uniref:Uncharacterized protein n=1 Tax=Sporisorium reilianum f. sp. reilianum TaxID=72559 RepID=A0A2N8UGU8_9BASI|nr:uncharacterized protein SRS1_20008 [Sporisorium reilianum f. sp. reilianum]